jgi:hypothetical protein
MPASEVSGTCAMSLISQRRLVNRFKVRLVAVTCCFDAVREAAVTKDRP